MAVVGVAVARVVRLGALPVPVAEAAVLDRTPLGLDRSPPG
jgi:hypothetical protein